MTKYMYGKPVAEKWRQEIAAQIETARNKGKSVTLAIVTVGADRASQIYKNQLAKLAESVGAATRLVELPEKTSKEEYLAVLRTLNDAVDITGILPLMPLPQSLELEARIVGARLNPAKDMDCLNPVNAGAVFLGYSHWASCTPMACMAVLDYYGIKLMGKQVVVIGRSNVVGKPVAMLLLARHATVTVCHSHSHDLPQLLRQADIIVAAVGKANFVQPDMVKEGVVIVDVGINALADGEIVGDVAIGAAAKAAAFTPVPGGIGVVSNMMVMARLAAAATEKND